VPISSATKGDGIGLRDEHSVADANSRCIQTDPGADDDIRITNLGKTCEQPAEQAGTDLSERKRRPVHSTHRIEATSKSCTLSSY
jgi:hypothetical protein